MCFLDLEKAYDPVPQGVLWVVFQEYGVPDLLLWTILALYNQSKSSIQIAGSKSDSFQVGVGLCQGCLLSLILFITFMDRSSRCSQGVEGVQFGGLRIALLLFTDTVVLLASSNCVLQLALERFAAEYEIAGV